jgi:uncharacterized membrane protein
MMHQDPGTRLQTDNPLSRMEWAISKLLRVGILMSLTLVATGVLVMFIHHPEYTTSTEALAHLTSEDYQFPTTLSGIFRDALAGQGRAIVLLGVFVLFLTPVARVAVSIIAFAWERDWTFVWITSIVMVFLLLSLVLGRFA